MLLGTDIAGGSVLPALEILELTPHVPCHVEDVKASADYPSCVISCARLRTHNDARTDARFTFLRRAEKSKTGDVDSVTLNNTLFSQLFTGGEETMSDPDPPASQAGVDALTSDSPPQPL